MMRLSPLLQPLASACCRAAATHGLPFARPLLTASCNPRTQQPQLVLSNSSSSSCRLAAPPRCISSSSGDQEGGSRPKGDGGNDNNNSVPRAESRQQQAVEQLTQLLQESLKAQQHTQVSWSRHATENLVLGSEILCNPTPLFQQLIEQQKVNRCLNGLIFFG